MTLASFTYALVVAFVSTLGFALLFHLRPKLLVPACLGGMLSWGLFLICSQYLDGVFLPCLIASAFSALYAQALANRVHAPMAVLYILAVVPLIPGSGLFNAMSNVVSNNWEMVAHYGQLTAQYACAIAFGMAIVTATAYAWQIFRSRTGK
ncbi:MAG: threonine/serine exporter family protein [Coriobacteriia bacterium]|nr:threonine/serine exporter family protein [Coriobacteriia bacterium]